MEISQTRLANLIGVPPRRINEIVLGKRGITADTALRLANVFGTLPINSGWACRTNTNCAKPVAQSKINWNT